MTAERSAGTGTTGLPHSPHLFPTAGFGIAVPALARGTANRSEDLRHPDRLAAQWSSSRVLIVDHAGRVELDPADGASALTASGAAPAAPKRPGLTLVSNHATDLTDDQTARDPVRANGTPWVMTPCTETAQSSGRDHCAGPAA